MIVHLLSRRGPATRRPRAGARRPPSSPRCLLHTGAPGSHHRARMPRRRADHDGFAVLSPTTRLRSIGSQILRRLGHPHAAPQHPLRGWTGTHHPQRRSRHAGCAGYAGPPRESCRLFPNAPLTVVTTASPRRPPDHLGSLRRPGCHCHRYSMISGTFDGQHRQGTDSQLRRCRSPGPGDDSAAAGEMVGWCTPAGPAQARVDRDSRPWPPTGDSTTHPAHASGVRCALQAAPGRDQLGSTRRPARGAVLRQPEGDLADGVDTGVHVIDGLGQALPERAVRHGQCSVEP